MTDLISQSNDLAATLVRGFAAVDDLLQTQYENNLWETPDRVAERLQSAIAARVLEMCQVYGADAVGDASLILNEAIDNLGRGELLDPWDVLAFRAPVAFRSHRVVLTDPPAFSADVTAVQSQLLRRGVTVLEEHEHRGSRILTVSSYSPEWAHTAVGELLPSVEIDWVGKTPREIAPARCVGWRDKGSDMIRVWVSLRTDQHIDEVVAAESDEEIVVLAFACHPNAGSSGGRREEPARIHLAAPIGDRPVVCGFSGKPIPRE